MMKEELKSQFDDMLPYMKKEFKSLIDDILIRAERLENSGKYNAGELQRIIRDSEKLFATDKKMKNLFSLMNP